MAATAGLPIRFAQVSELSALGLPPDAFSFLNTTLESSAYVCSRSQGQLVVLETANPSNPPLRFPVTCDSAIMHPTDKIVALRAPGAAPPVVAMQVYNLATKQRLRGCDFPEPIEFWSWISGSTIGIVTATAVYHWAEGAAAPTQVFQRVANLQGHQIISYRTDAAQKWLALVGIAQAADGRITGALQLFSVDRNMSQPFEAHSCAFASYQASPEAPAGTLFAMTVRTAQGGKLFVLEVGEPTGFQRVTTDVFFPPEAAQDFPVGMHISAKHQSLFMLTKFGYIFVFHLTTGATILQCRISTEAIFATAKSSSDGVLAVNRRGQVLTVNIDEQNFIPYIIKTLNNLELARQIAVRTGLPGSEDLFSAQFNRLFASGDYKGAATVAAESPGGVLRTTSTIQKFAQLPSVPGQPSPLLQYFGNLLEKGALNKLETVELAKPILQQGRPELLAKWFSENKLECSEEFGDLLRPVNPQLALQVYAKAEVKNKVIALLAETQQYDKLVAYAKRAQFTPDWATLLQKVVTVNPPGAAQLAQMLLADAELSASRPDVNVIVDMFMQRNMVRETTSIILAALADPADPQRSLNRPEDAVLQTKLLEVNLRSGASHVADAILGNGMFTHFDQARIAQLCERGGLPLRALNLYTSMDDIKRVLSTINMSSVQNPDEIVRFFSKLSDTNALICLREMMRANPRGNLQAVVNVAVQYVKQLSAKDVLAMLEEHQTYEGIFMYLQTITKTNNDPELHFKYIEAAAKVGQFAEVERMVRDSKFYDPVKTKDFLKDAKLNDQLPLIIVCDRYDFVAELTQYLYKNNMSKYIEAYVQKINPANTPIVLGALIDMDCPEDYIKNLLNSVRALCPVEDLVEQLSTRNRLRLIQPYLELKAQEGSQDPALHNALARIYIDTNNKAEQFLTTNPFYDSKVVGKYVENRDPYLAFVTYKRGGCTDELVDVTNRHSLFKHQARYLVEKADLALWAKVLDASNTYRPSLIDQVVQVALPESKNPPEVSVAVKAFMQANLPNELLELLDKIVIEPGTPFTGNLDLSNLLLLTAIRANKPKVMEYVHRLEHYSAADIAGVAIGAEMFEEAVEIYKKAKLNVQAIQVLIEHVRSLDRAAEFAMRVNEPGVFSQLAKAQLDSGMVKEAIEFYIKGNDPEFYLEVIHEAEKAELWAELVRYLQMARKKSKIPVVETELCFALAKKNALSELEEFIASPNCAVIQTAGDRCYDQGMYEAAKLLFNNISNHARLATTLVRLNQFAQAVDAARKANNVRTWKEVNIACVEAHEFRLAQACGQHIVVHGDELEELIRNYEIRGHFDEIISLIESSLTFENAHMGMFTELAILFSRHNRNRLMDHLKIHHARINLQKVIRVCSANRQWKEVCFLHATDGNYDNAASTMIAHSAEAWEHKQFCDILQNVSRTDIYYDAINFYIDEHPLQTKDLLAAITSKVEAKTVVAQVRRRKALGLIHDWLVSVQNTDVDTVNEALNSLYIEDNDYIALRSSIETYTNFDHLSLAAQLEKNEMLEFRRIASYLYRTSDRFEQAISVSQRDGLWKDQIEAAAASKNKEVVESLLTSFAEGSAECFAAVLYTCYEFISPDVALALAWRNNKMEMAMPYLVQVLAEYTRKVDTLYEARAKQGKAADAPPAFASETPSAAAFGSMLPPGAQYMSAGGVPAGAIPLPVGAIPLPAGAIPLPAGAIPLPAGYASGHPHPGYGQPYPSF